MVLGRDERAGMLGAADEKLFVDGLDRRHVDDAGLDAIGGQQLGGFHRARHFYAAGDDGDILAVAHDMAFADLEFVVVAEHAPGRAAAGAHIDRAFEFQHRARRQRHLGGIGRRNHRHAGNGAERGHVFQRLRRTAVRADIEAGMRRHDLGVAAGISERQTRLLHRAQTKHGEGGDDGDESCCSQTTRRRHHVLFGDAELQETVGMALAEMVHARAARNIRIQHDNILEFVGEARECFAKSFAQRIIALRNQCRCRAHAKYSVICSRVAPSAASASSACCCVSFTLPCQVGMFSM